MFIHEIPKRTLIKKALVIYAERHKRPYYPLTFVDYFIECIKLNRPHVLTNEIIKIAESLDSASSYQENISFNRSKTRSDLSKLKRLCHQYGYISTLIELANISRYFLGELIDSDLDFFNSNYYRVQPFLEKAQSILEQKTIDRRKQRLIRNRKNIYMLNLSLSL